MKLILTFGFLFLSLNGIAQPVFDVLPEDEKSYFLLNGQKVGLINESMEGRYLRKFLRAFQNYYGVMAKSQGDSFNPDGRVDVIFLNSEKFKIKLHSESEGSKFLKVVIEKILQGMETIPSSVFEKYPDGFIIPIGMQGRESNT